MGPVAAYFGFVFGFGLAALLLTADRNGWRAEAIERGYAQYCPDDGQWAWKGECDK